MYTWSYSTIWLTTFSISPSLLAHCLFMGRHSKVLLWKRKFAALSSVIVMLTFSCSSSSMCTLHSSSSVHVVIQLLERPTTISPRQKYVVGDSELGMLMCLQTPKAFLSCLSHLRPRPNMVEVVLPIPQKKSKSWCSQLPLSLFLSPFIPSHIAEIFHVVLPLTMFQPPQCLLSFVYWELLAGKHLSTYKGAAHQLPASQSSYDSQTIGWRDLLKRMIWHIGYTNSANNFLESLSSCHIPTMFGTSTFSFFR